MSLTINNLVKYISWCKIGQKYFDVVLIRFHITYIVYIYTCLDIIQAACFGNNGDNTNFRNSNESTKLVKELLDAGANVEERHLGRSEYGK